MLMIRPENADFVFPAERYGLVIKGQAYDFTVTGPITEAAQCLEVSKRRMERFIPNAGSHMKNGCNSAFCNHRCPLGRRNDSAIQCRAQVGRKTKI
jgi:hypothetical protein